MNDDIDDNQIDEVEEELKQRERKKKKKSVPSIFKKNNNIGGAEVQTLEITQTFEFKDNSGT